MTMVLDLDAPIIPGRSLGGIEIGARQEDLPPDLPPDGGAPNEYGYRRFQSDDVVAVVKDGKVDAVHGQGGYRGRFDGILGIGTTVLEIIRRYGPIAEGNEDSLMLLGVPGIRYSTQGDNIDVPSFIDARVDRIGVYYDEAEFGKSKVRAGGQVPSENVTIYYHPVPEVPGNHLESATHRL